MSTKLASRAITVAGCLALAACGSDDLPSNGDGTEPNDTGGVPGAAGSNAAGSSSAGTSATGGVPGAAGMSAASGAPAAGATVTAGAGGAALGGHGGHAGTAGRAGDGGASAVAGAAGQSGGARGGTGSGGRAEGGGGQGGSAGRGQGGNPNNAGAGAGAGGRAGGAAGGAGGMGPEAPGGQISGYGLVRFQANSHNEIVRLQTTMFVPLEPPPSGTLFLWPGLQPGGANFEPIDNGVLQPVLSWGPSCAPGKQPRDYSTWWISGQYVNTNGNEPGYTDCNGGPIMSVEVGDALIIDMVLDGTEWTQTVTDQESDESVAYKIDMQGQAQNYAYFVVEEYSSAPVSEVIFTDTTLTFGTADSADCKLAARGKTDYVSVPVASSDGLTCSIAEIILRAEGID